MVKWFKESVIEDNLDGNNLAIQLRREHVMAGIIPSTIFSDVAFPENLLLFMKGLHDERMRDWLEEVKRVNKPLSPSTHDYWTHIDLEDSDLEASSASGSDSDEEDTDNKSGSKDSKFMDDVDVEGGDENSMSGNPKRTVQKVSESAANSSNSKVTGLKSSKADGNAPAEKNGEKKPQNKHGKKLKGSNVEIREGKVPAKVPDDTFQK